MVDTGQGRRSVEAWSFGAARLERYRHAPGPGDPVATHTHDEYQVGVSLDAAGEYRYRGARHPVPPGALRIVQAGEPHASRDFGGNAETSTLLLYLPVPTLRDVAVQVGGAGEPFFPVPAVLDRPLAADVLALGNALGAGVASTLERDARLLATLARVVARHSRTPPAPRRVGREPAAVGRVKAFLEAHPLADVSLAELAAMANLSPHHLLRAFAREVGLPPHRYRVQIRIARAKILLAGGMPIGAVAAETGFADQSHLGRHFKRLVGVSPGRYRGMERR